MKKTVPRFSPCPEIADVSLVHPQWFEDSRGRFCESFRNEWFPQRNWEEMQSNRSESSEGVLRGLHYHFRQVDYWQVLAGTIEVGLADLRASSPTYGKSALIRVEANSGLGIFIPPGIAHGFLSLTAATLLYLVDRYYDGTDEYGVIWNDRELDVNWSTREPLLSERDKKNPTWRMVPSKLRPR